MKKRERERDKEREREDREIEEKKEIESRSYGLIIPLGKLLSVSDNCPVHGGSTSRKVSTASTKSTNASAGGPPSMGPPSLTTTSRLPVKTEFKE